MTIRVLAISGSLRTQSYNTALLRAAKDLAPEDTEVVLYDIGDLPMINTDLTDEAMLAPVESLKQAIAEADAVLLAVPEYNYGIAAPLKNALDWASRPAYQSVFRDKAVGIMGASVGGVGTARAQAHLRGVLTGMVAQIFNYPEFALGSAKQRFDEEGTLNDEKTKKILTGYMAAFQVWVERVSS